MGTSDAMIDGARQWEPVVHRLQRAGVAADAVSVGCATAAGARWIHGDALWEGGVSVGGWCVGVRMPSWMREAVGCWVPADRRVLELRDSETRLLLGAVPVVDEEAAAPAALASSRCCVTRSGTVVAKGRDLDDAHVAVAAALFAIQVGFAAWCAERGTALGAPARAALSAWCVRAKPDAAAAATVDPGPYGDVAQARGALVAAGKALVAAGLVDAIFGNVSVRVGDEVLISATGAPLDALEHAVVRAPLSAAHPEGASSEWPAHRAVYLSTDAAVVVHGHPMAAVALSLVCGQRGACPVADRCHVACPAVREQDGVPVVPGEVGGGPTGLARTVPPALARCGAVTVLGHGTFASDDRGFCAAVERLCAVEVRAQASLASLCALTG